MTLRPARRDDAPAIAALHLRTALHAFGAIFPPEAPQPVLGDLEQDWVRRLGSHDVFVAEEGGSVVGVVVAGADPGAASRGHLSRLYVAPERWDAGIGSALHDRALSRLVARGFGLATLWVLEANGRGRAWYERRGWRLTDRRKPAYARGGVDDVAYELDLPPRSRCR